MTLMLLHLLARVVDPCCLFPSLVAVSSCDGRLLKQTMLIQVSFRYSWDPAVAAVGNLWVHLDHEHNVIENIDPLHHVHVSYFIAILILPLNLRSTLGFMAIFNTPWTMPLNFILYCLFSFTLRWRSFVLHFYVAIMIVEVLHHLLLSRSRCRAGWGWWWFI